MNDHSSRRTITRTLKRPTRIQHGPCLRIPIWSCFWWGLPCRELLPDTRCALTAPFHPYHFSRLSRKKVAKMAVYSLLHLPSAFTAQALPGTLPYEARTFLPCLSHGDLSSSDRLAHFKSRILTNFATNCSCFFEQLVFCTYPSIHHMFPHDSDLWVYSRQGRKVRIAADHDDQYTQYIDLDESRK